MSLLWERFEYVACICFTGYKDRQERMSQELERVGLLQKTHFFWDFPSPFTSSLARLACADQYHQKMFPIGHNNYRAIKTAFELGKHSILVIEDDVRFLDNIEMMERAINALPKDYEIAMLDKNFPREEWIKYRKAHIKIWGEIKSIAWQHFNKFHSSGCYALSREGMRKFIQAYEKDGASRRLKNNDEYFNATVFVRNKMYAAFPNIATQGLVGIAGSCSPLEGYWLTNEYQGGRQEMYNLDCPYIHKHNFLSLLYRAADREVQGDAIGALRSDKTIYCGLSHDMTSVIKGSTFRTSFDDKTKGVKYGATVIWGNSTIDNNLNALQLAYRDNCPVLLCEDGFIRSYTTWADKHAPAKHRLGHSVIFDSSAYYFDATRVSTVEKLLNDPEFKVTPAQCAESRRLIDKIVSTKISKYNHQPIYRPQIGRAGVRKVLVVDQSYGDFSIARGLADDKTFLKMLDAAKKENPDADILVKTHPDTIAGKKGEKKGYYQDIKEGKNIYKVTFPINPYSLMEICDKVYVCSSGMGMEALMAGKEVHVFGMPFYAGWGLTIDDQHLERRTNKRTLEELFYIFYCLYTHWVDPDKGCETTLDKVIKRMVEMRDVLQGTTAKRSIPPHRVLSTTPVPAPRRDVKTDIARGRRAIPMARRQRLA